MQYIEIKELNFLYIEVEFLNATAPLTRKLIWWYHRLSSYDEFLVIFNKIQGKLTLLNSLNSPNFLKEFFENFCTIFRVEFVQYSCYSICNISGTTGGVFPHQNISITGADSLAMNPVIYP